MERHGVSGCAKRCLIKPQLAAKRGEHLQRRAREFVVAQVFDEENALDKLESFASLNGPAFYGLEPNERTITLSRQDWTVPDALHIGDGRSIRPFKAGEVLNWKCSG